MKKISSRLANLTPEQREKLLKKLREQKKEQLVANDTKPIDLENTKALESDFQLSFSQQRIWFIDQLSNQRAAYHIPACLTIKGALNIEALKKSFALLISRHESLRMRFENDEGFAKAVPFDGSDFILQKADLSSLEDNAQKQQLKIFSQQIAIKPFALEKDSPIRAQLVKLLDKNEKSQHVLMICMHHIISDAWSMGIFIKEISLAYSAFTQDLTQQSPDLGDLPFRYLDFSAWQHAQIKSNTYEKQRRYWKSTLKDVETLNFPVDKPRPPQQSFSGQQLSFIIPAALSKKLKGISESEGKTLFMVLLGAWQVLLYRYTGQEDICVGTPVANRNHIQLEGTIGLFINTLAIRNKISPNLTFLDMLNNLQKISGEAFANQDLPFEQLIDDLGLERDVSQSPIFQNLFSFQDKELLKGLDFTGLSIELEPIHTQTAKFDLSLSITAKQDYLEAQLEFNTDLFYPNTINRLAENFITLLESIVIDTSENVSLLNFLANDEYQSQLKDWPRKKEDFPTISIAQQFIEQAKKTPNRVALSYQEENLTYKELDQQSNRLANYLIKQGIKSEDYVGLCLSRNIDLIVSILAVIKTGAAYLPIDPSYPCERIKLLIDQGELSFLLTQQKFQLEKIQASLVISSCPTLNVDSYRTSKKFNNEDSSHPVVEINPEQLLYVIFTSGSSGIPKRTAATHRSESNLVSWYHASNQIENSPPANKDAQNRYLLMSPISFDLAQKNIFTPLLNGDLLVLPDIEHFDPHKIAHTIDKQKITCLNCSPSAFYPLLHDEVNFSLLKSLRYLFLGGESIQLEKIHVWLAQSQCQLINTYGPSECTDIASYYIYDKTEQSHEGIVPIGQPSKNVDLFVLDNNLQLLPRGAHGQLFIGGEGLGPGYLGSDNLSAKSFIENPLAGRSGTIYATGDMVRYIESGDLQYLGRRDDQIKIRGHRVEIAEIVSALFNEHDVIDAAVTLKKQANHRECLVAYLVLNEGCDFDPHYFKRALKLNLPDFMIPSAYLSIKELPLSPNGKLDLKLLPEPDLSTMAADEFLAPSNHNEKILQEIWQDILGLEKVGVHDNFFELGGDSILSIQIISAAKKQGLVLRPNEIFRYPTILELAQVAENEQTIIQAEQGAIKGSYNLSPVQAWFFDNFSAEVNIEELSHFNQSILLRLTNNISLKQLQEIALTIASHHDSLTLRFNQNDNTWQQAHRDSALSLEDMQSFVSEVKDQDLLDSLRSAQSKLSIETGKLFHICLIDQLKSGKREFSLYFVIHHLLVDGVSWRILLEDLDTLLTVYNTSKQTEHTLLDKILPDKTLSFKQWNKLLNGISNSHFLNEDRQYWLDTFDAIKNYQDIFPEVTALKTGQYADQKRKSFTLNQRTTDQFLKQSNKVFHTEANDILLCALHRSLLTEKINNGLEVDELLIQLEGHGRDLEESLYEKRSLPDISRTVGWFTSLYPVLLSANSDKYTTNWGSQLKAIKEQLHAIPNKGIGFGLHSTNDELSSLISGLVKPLISFNYLGQFGTQTKTKNFIVDTDYRNIEGAEHVDQHANLPKNTALDVVIFISDGHLHCDFLYDSSRFQEAHISLYLTSYEKNLKSLITYCCEQENTFLSPSDLSATTLSQHDIELIEKHVIALSENNKNFPERLKLETIHDLLPIQSGILFHSIFSDKSTNQTTTSFITANNTTSNNAANKRKVNKTDTLKIDGVIESHLHESYRSDTYFEQFCVQMSGNLNISHLEKAWRLSIRKYANLRSAFYWDHGEPQQLVFNDVPFSIDSHDIRPLIDVALKNDTGESPHQLAKKVLDDFLKKDKVISFDLSAPPLMRVNILFFSETEYWLVWSYHHVLLDGWSVPLVLNDLFENYEKIVNLEQEKVQGKLSKENFESGKISGSQQSLYRFEDYVAWHRTHNHKEDIFWKKELSGFSVANTIDLEPLAIPITDKDINSEESVELVISAELSESLNVFAKQNRLTLNSIIQGAWAKLLSHYCESDINNSANSIEYNNVNDKSNESVGERDILFGSTVSGRSDQLEGIEHIVGLFINTLPLRIKIKENISVIDFLHTMQLKQQDISQYQTSSLSKIQKIAGFEPSASLFDSIFVFENFPVSQRLRQSNPWFTVQDFHSFEKTNYPITISVQPNVGLTDSIRFKILFDNAKYRKATMSRLLGHLEIILKGFIEQPNDKLLSIPYISQAEYKSLADWNKTSTSYPHDANLVQLFLDKVEQAPKHIALKFDELELSYEALNKNTNRLAAFLGSYHCKKGDRVVLFMDRSIEFLSAVVAVSKTGAAYIPLDPNYPPDRLRYMLSDCQPDFILSVASNRDTLEMLLSDSSKVNKANEMPDSQRQIIYIDELQKELSTFSEENYGSTDEVDADDLAYLMYTSGSTGQAKAVCLNHRSIIRLVVNTWYVNIGAQDKIGHICNVCFDASAYEIWGALLNGATLVGFDRDTLLSEEYFAKKLVDESVTNMLMPTSLFHSYSRHRPEIFCKMRSLLAGGEPLLPELARRVLAINPQLSLLNVYGPTENGVLTTVFDTWNLVEGAINTPVGRPVSNSTVYIVDKNLKEVPVGVVGELVSGGDGVGLGYWNKPDTTKKSYITNPFSQKEHARMYCTGDLARRLPNGEFEVLGRQDDQLKIRGFRIEPSEIIECLIKIHGIKDAVVIATTASEESTLHQKHLVAYFIRDTHQDTHDDDFKNSLKEKLSASLPAHMVPNHYIEISNIPMTPNGKLDKFALSKPNFDEIANKNYVAPRNQLERDLVSVWSEVLNIKSLGVFDNFFELGGDSIISIQIVSRAKRAGIDISPKLLFENPSISSLATKVSQKNSMIIAEQGLMSGEVPLSPIQQWFFEQELPQPHHFNQSLLFSTKQFITLQNLTPIVSALLKQHDALRLRFTRLKNEWVQKHHNSARSLSSLVDILSEHFINSGNEELSEDVINKSLLLHAKGLQESLSLDKGPVFKVVLYHLGNQKQKLLVIAHHLIMDGVSWRILFDDISIALQQQSNNQSIDFGPKSSSFQLFSKKLAQYAKSEYIGLDKNYWLDTLINSINCDRLKVQNEKSSSTKKINQLASKRIRFHLNESLSQKLLLDSHSAYHTDVQDILVLALYLSLKQSNICDSLWMNLEGHGRDIFSHGFAEQIDNTRTLAWFTTMYPVLIDILEPGLKHYDIPTLLMHVKQSLRDIPHQGASYMLLKYFDKDFYQEAIKTPSPEISFNYLGKISSDKNNQYIQLDDDYVGDDNGSNNPLSHPFNFTAALKSKQFEFQVLIDENYVDDDTLESFKYALLDNLALITECCTNELSFGFTPSDLPYLPIQQAELNNICDSFRNDQPSNSIRAMYPLSPMQEGMLFHSRLDHASGVYCEQVSVLLSGDLNITAINKAWSETIASHDILRTSFVWENLSKPLQLVAKNSQLNIQLLDWRNEKNIEQRIQSFLKQDRAKGFDFSQAPLMRLHYIQCPESTIQGESRQLGRLIWTYHHILLDGWSMPILMREVFSRYNLLSEESNSTLSNAANEISIENSDQKINSKVETIAAKGKGRYENYIAWLYRNRASKTDEVESFWKTYLSGFDEPNALSFEKPYEEPNKEPFSYEELSFQFDKAQTKQLELLSAKHQITLNTIMQAAWALLINRYSGDSDIVFGITVSGRPAELNDVESIIGLFINTIPFRVKVNAADKLDDWLKNIFKNQVQLRQFETSPLVDIQAQSQLENSRALFDSILVFENYPLDDSLGKSLNGLHVEELKIYEQTNFPLSLIILPGQNLDIRLLFDTGRFDHSTIESLLKHFKTILLGFCSFEDDLETELRDIDYLSEEEKNSLVDKQKQDAYEYPRDLYLQEIVAQQAQNSIALIIGNKEISFKELELSANQLAGFLQSEYQVHSGDRVVVCLNRSAELIISILAILKLGASYVPLDPAYPEERQRYIVEDTQTNLIINDNKSATLLKYLSANKAFKDSIVFLNLDEQHDAIKSAALSNHHLNAYSETENIPAAILYTSGSTGQPKGVCLTHRGLSRMVLNTNYMKVSENDRVAHVSNICFDAASFEIWCALLNGIPLVIVEKDIVLDLVRFEDELKRQQVSILLITTALFNLLAREQVSAFNTINYLFFGGESCDINMVRRVSEQMERAEDKESSSHKNGPKHLMHMYGPSENSTYATWYEVKNIPTKAKTIPIGQPVSNTQVFIMNQRGDLLPEGVVGEIVCAGDGLALGYLNKPEQTKQAFVMRSILGEPSQRMYLTGDLGRRLPDGNIDILGRIDNQVKIRGYRIEPEEVTAHINTLVEIKNSYVLVKEDQDNKKYLIAYYIPEKQWSKEKKELASRTLFLKQKLKSLMPEYMVPNLYLEIKELPLTPNGKIDTKALPVITSELASENYVLPASDLEKSLVGIWQEVLQKEKIGVHDDFFELGGHSLLATQIHSRIRQQLAIEIPLRTLFELPTIKEFSDFWEAISRTQNSQASSNSIDNEEDFEEGEL